jgi:hypothetical protein
MPKRSAIGTMISRFGVIKRARCVVALSSANEFGRFERETRVDVTLRRIDWKPDFSP